MGNSCITNDSSISSPALRNNASSPFTFDLPPVSTKKIELLTFNIFCRPPGIHNNGNDYKDERLEEFFNIFHKYDIICLQEMFSAYSSRLKTVLSKAKAAGFLYHSLAPKYSPFSKYFIDSGLLILSKYPIVDTRFCPYPAGIGADYYVNKGILYSQIQIGNSKIHLFTSHTQATYDKTARFVLKRQEQFAIFQAFLKETLIQTNYNQNEMVLLTGDLNVNARDPRRWSPQSAEMADLVKELPGLAKKKEFTDYEALIHRLTDNHNDEIEDLVFNSYNIHPTTYGAYYLDEKNEKKPAESVLTSGHSCCNDESLDYIFRYIPKSLEQERSPALKLESKATLRVKEYSAKVEEFFVEGKPFEQLSDHYGVKVTLEYSGLISDSDQSYAETDIGSNYLSQSPSGLLGI